MDTLIKSILAPLKDVSSRRGIDGYAFHQRIPSKKHKYAKPVLCNYS